MLRFMHSGLSQSVVRSEAEFARDSRAVCKWRMCMRVRVQLDVRRASQSLRLNAQLDSLLVCSVAFLRLQVLGTLPLATVPGLPLARGIGDCRSREVLGTLPLARGPEYSAAGEMSWAFCRWRKVLSTLLLARGPGYFAAGGRSWVLSRWREVRGTWPLARGPGHFAAGERSWALCRWRRSCWVLSRWRGIPGT